MLVVEHDEQTTREADRVIDLGPEGGEAGGRVVAQGTPERVAQSRSSITAKYLKVALARANGGQKTGQLEKKKGLRGRTASKPSE